MELTQRFEAAVARSRSLPEKPSNDILLQIYSLYKQATEGDVTGEAPGMFDFVALAKHRAWEELKGTSKEAAMQRYTDLIEKLEAGG